MALVCELTGKKRSTGNHVSHSQRKVKRTVLPNLQTKRFIIPEIEKRITLTLSTSAIKNITKHGGLAGAILKAKESHLSQKLVQVKKELLKKIQA